MKRYIIFDTETTGLDSSNDRVFEVGAVEIIDRKQTGNTFYRSINPEVEFSEETIKICKIQDTEIYKTKPKFVNIADDFWAYLNNNSSSDIETFLVAHNIRFDLDFMNAELGRCGRPTLSGFKTIDTVRIVKAQYPRQSASLDTICKTLKIDLTERDELGHGALRDSEILATVFLMLLDGKSDDYLETFDKRSVDFAGFAKQPLVLDVRLFGIANEELQLHQDAIAMLGIDDAW